MISWLDSNPPARYGGLFVQTTPPWTGALFGYHVHVYFSDAEEAAARKIFETALADFQGQSLMVFKPKAGAHGPHPKGAFEMRFPPGMLEKVTLWLLEKRAGLSVLVHQVTGDDPADHFEGAFWMGEVLILDRSRLDPSPPKKMRPFDHAPL